jgi:thymidylate synthase (FAD)
MHVKLVAITAPLIEIDGRKLTAEEFISYCARVSNPNNQLNLETASRLLGYCIKHQHWSIFEQASMTIEIQTSRAIAAQILRHRSFCFQEFSQRYSAATAGHEEIELRNKAGSNRQGSGDVVLDESLHEMVARAVRIAEEAYGTLIDAGVAPECARMVLPMATKTTLYMTGSIRSWIHYIMQRTTTHAQKEHRIVGFNVEEIFNHQFPSIAEAIKLHIT